MTASAFLWPSGVDPAQHAASTIIGLSGKKALRIIALEITQISVQTPISVILSTLSFLMTRRLLL